MSLTALPVTQSDLTALQAGIAVFTDPTTATTVANQINTNTPPGTSVFSYATQLFQGQVGGTQIAMAVDSLIQGGVPTAGALQPVDKLDPVKNELQNLTVNPGQGAITAASALGVKIGVDPIVFASESIAVGLAATGDGTQNNFTKLWGGLTQATFVSTLATQTGIFASQITIWVNNWLSFYNGVGAAAVQPGLTATTQAYAATIGDAVGNAIKLDAGPGGTAGTAALSAAVFNALVNNAEVLAGTPGAKYQPGVSLFAQTPHIPLQGEIQPGATVTLTILQDTVGPDQAAPFKTISGANNVILAPVVAGVGTLQGFDVINGGGAPGVNKLGLFGNAANFTTGAAPTVTNVQEIHAKSATNNGTLSFVNIDQGTGQLKLAAISGTFDAATDTNTTFSGGLKLTTPVAVENYTGKTATFVFAGATGVEAVDLTVNKAGNFTNVFNNAALSQAAITINKVGTINMHVAGPSGVSFLASDTASTLNIDGSGNLHLVDNVAFAINLKNIDASKMTGLLTMDGTANGTNALTVKVGSGGSALATDGSSPERITFDTGKTAGDAYFPQIFNNVAQLNAGEIAATGTLDAGSIWVSSFNPAAGQDHIVLSPANLAQLFVATNIQNGVAEGLASLKLAAEFIAVGDAGKSVDVFTYTVGGVDSTYVFRDANANNVVDNGDGFLKIVGVAGNTVTAANFISSTGF